MSRVPNLCVASRGPSWSGNGFFRLWYLVTSEPEFRPRCSRRELRLTRGRATVKLDADFAKVVKLNGYRVFLTPEGDCQGLYVRRRGTSFEVHELQGGTRQARGCQPFRARRGRPVRRDKR